jgi:phosphatidylserine decarboxylase
MCKPLRKGHRLDFRQKRSHIPFAREGIPYVLGAAFATLVTAILGHGLLTWVLLALTLLIGHFFRDPERMITAGAGEVVSPADGKVIAIERCEEPCFTHKTCWKISIFMSVFNVHVNRIPVTGTVRGVRYQQGRFFAANRLLASRNNEQNWLWLQSDTGQDVVLTQVAGWIARRIVCWPTEGDRVLSGERFGLIRFGSRVDVYLPEHSRLKLNKGDRVIAGGSILCQLD